MRTTIRLDDHLLRRAKARAAESGRSLNDFVCDAVRAALAAAPTRRQRVDLPTFPGGVLLPGVDLDDSAGLLDLMEGPATYPRTPGAEALARRVAEGSGSGRKGD
jgi:hypothetical protein